MDKVKSVKDDKKKSEQAEMKRGEKLVKEKPQKTNKSVNKALDAHEKKLETVVDTKKIKNPDGERKVNKRAELVKRIMVEKGLKMIEASKYVKDNNLYKKE